MLWLLCLRNSSVRPSTLSSMFPGLTEGFSLSPDFLDLAKRCIFGSISSTSAQERSEEREQQAESSGMPREDPSTPRRWTSRLEVWLGMEGMVGSWPWGGGGYSRAQICFMWGRGLQRWDGEFLGLWIMTNSSEQWFSNGAVLPPRGHLAMYEDIFDCHDLGRVLLASSG